MFCVFFFKQKTAYEMRISDWSSDVCSSDLQIEGGEHAVGAGDERRQQVRHQAHEDHLAFRITEAHVVLDELGTVAGDHQAGVEHEIGRASCRERVCQYV